MTRIVLVSCTSQKRDEPAKARDLYDPSRLFRKQRDYAQVAGDCWFILSAKHGLVHPDDVLEPYEHSMDDVDDPAAWAEQVGVDLQGHVEMGDTVVFTAGSDYADPLTPVLEHRFGVDVLEPFRGQGIGTRQKEMERKKRDLQNRDLHDY